MIPDSVARELSRAAYNSVKAGPRPKLSLGCVLLFAFPFLAIGILMPIYSAYCFLVELPVYLDPVRVTARAVVWGSPQFIKYTYMVGNQVYERVAQFPPGVQAGPIEITYSRSHPELSRAIQEDRISVATALFAAFWDFNLALWGFFIWLFVGGVRRGQELQERSCA